MITIKIGAISLYVEDIENMVRFYNDVMKMNIEWDGSGFCCVRMESGVFFNLCKREKPLTLQFPNGIKDTHQLTFGSFSSVEEVNAEYERLIKAGAKHIHEPISQPYGLHEAVVADPEGNLIEFCCEI